MRLLIVGIGGFAGAVARYLVDGLVMTLVRASFPLGTLVVNLSGSFILGFLYALTMSGNDDADDQVEDEVRGDDDANDRVENELRHGDDD